MGAVQAPADKLTAFRAAIEGIVKQAANGAEDGTQHRYL
jgi:hypothetical protein